MIALVHPDVQATDFPPDAATRVNTAYATLTSATGRAALDAELVRESQNYSPRGATRRRTGTADRAKTTARVTLGGSGKFHLRAPKGSLLWMGGLLALGAFVWLVAVMAPEQSDALIEARPVMTMSEELTSQRLVQHGNAPSQDRASDVLPALADQQADAGRVAATLSRDLTLSTLPVASAGAAADEDSRGSGMGTRTVSREAASTRQATAPETTSRLPVPRRAKAPPSPVADATTRPVPSAAARTGKIDAATLGPTGAAKTAPGTVSATIGATTLAPPAALAPLNTVVPVTVSPVTTRPTAIRTVTEAETAPSIEVDDILLKLIAAYETGSTVALSRLLSPRIGGRSALLAAYDRFFRETTSRTLRLGQLTHRRIDNRVVSSGPATVTTVSLASGSEQTNIFLEIEIVREREGLFIDRLASYAPR